METSDFFRSRIDTMINLSDPLGLYAVSCGTRQPYLTAAAALKG